MRLVNIANIGRKIFLFIRDNNGKLSIIEDNNFFFYYYFESPEGGCISYNGKLLKKKFVSKPSDIRKEASYGSWESDVKPCARYLIDKVNTIEKTPIKFSFVDIETLSKSLPDPTTAPDPVSCISASNSFTDEISTFYLGDYDTEYNMIEAFINYLKKERYDILLGWNLEGFDYPYLYNRFPDFAKKISPESIMKNNFKYKGRYITGDILYPIGTSIVDYMQLDKKYTLNRKREYSLNARLKEVIGREKEIKKLDFSKLSPELKQRNINDVRDMMEMEKKLNYIPMLDGIRRISKIQWEDYNWNSRVIDNLLLSEARKKKIVLPNKPKKEDEGEDFEGAFRKCYKRGTVFDCGSYDLAGAYLNTILEFSLDPANVYDEKVENSIPINVTDRETKEIKATYYVKQNQELLLPNIAKTLLDEKNKFKELLKNTDPNSSEFKEVEEKYKAWKGISLSAWGSIGLKYFRYYDHRVSSMITSIVRDCLHYVVDELKKLNYEVLYIDTDGGLVDDKGKNIVDLLNSLIQKWSQERYNRPTAIRFDYEGNYEKLFILALCRYKGYLRRPDGELEEKIVGIESKRKDSTIYLKQFQTELLEKLMNKETKENTIAWIKNEIKELRNKSLRDISFPAKLSNKNYKNLPIFKRALDNTKELKKKTGELFYWLYIKPDRDPYIETHIYIDNEIDEIRKRDLAKKDILAEFAKKGIDKKRIKVLHKKDKPCNVQAFDEDNYNHIDREIDVDWELMIKRNIINKAEVIFEAMNWDIANLGFIEENQLKIPFKTTQNKPKVGQFKEIWVKVAKEPELPIKEAKKANMCDFRQCKQNKEGICIAKDCIECPKNNDQSVYEKEELLKENGTLEEYYSE